MKNILAINAGSSSLRFQLIQMPKETVIAQGMIERIGLPDSNFIFETNGNKEEVVGDIKDHEVAVRECLDKLTSSGSIASLDEINAVGHHVVHGGERFTGSVKITEQVIFDIEDLSSLAP